MRIKLDSPIASRDLARLTDGQAVPQGLCFTHICTDSRELMSGDLFFALEGKNESGELYVKTADRLGCYTVSRYSGALRIKVPDTSIALLHLAEGYLEKQSVKIRIGVTGSVGKTTVKSFLAKILQASFKVHCSKENYNNHIGLPLTLLEAPKNTEAIICEMGMNKEKEISLLSRTLKPSIGIITKIGHSHIGNLGSREAIARAKLEILDGMSSDGILLTPYAESTIPNIKRGRTVGLNSLGADYSLNKADDGYYSFFKNGEEILSLKPTFSEEFLLQDLAFALAAAHSVGMKREDIMSGASAVSEEQTRFRLYSIGERLIIDDAYNSSPESVQAGFELLSRYKNSKKAVILGDILELGEYSEQIHEQIGRLCAQLDAEKVIFIGDMGGAFLNGYRRKCTLLPLTADRASICEYIKTACTDCAVIYFKASHRLGLSEIAKEICKQGWDN